ALDERTRAVIAVNLFGIPERMAEIRRRLPPGAVLIEDAAQALPLHPPGWSGDLVVLSFGRGKPVSLLGGGAVLCRDEGLTRALPQLPAVPASTVRFRLRAALYNLLTRPRCYWLPALLPLGLGETRYRPLGAVQGTPRPALRALPANLAARRTAESIAYPELITTALAKLIHGGGVDLPGQLGVSTSTLLRYPLLAADEAQRDRLLTALNDAGLGATSLYGKILPEIDTVPGESSPAGDYPHARAFAARLLTLPLHNRVTPAAAARIGAVIERVVPPQPPLPLENNPFDVG
ncbi:MAG: DegT/DnrJ/EryC1/StrS family aminotransferase, partial [Pseudomonadota bacterium]|nr:DegT/DnrJ/EryC1/StrS family aminotransferase [Pseudomonadota bacterium]